MQNANHPAIPHALAPARRAPLHAAQPAFKGWVAGSLSPIEEALARRLAMICLFGAQEAEADPADAGRPKRDLDGFPRERGADRGANAAVAAAR